MMTKLICNCTHNDVEICIDDVGNVFCGYLNDDLTCDKGIPGYIPDGNKICNYTRLVRAIGE